MEKRKRKQIKKDNRKIKRKAELIKDDSIFKENRSQGVIGFYGQSLLKPLRKKKMNKAKAKQKEFKELHKPKKHATIFITQESIQANRTYKPFSNK